VNAFGCVLFEYDRQKFAKFTYGFSNQGGITLTDDRTEFLSKGTFERLKILLVNTRWFKYDRDYLCVNKSQFGPVIFEPPCSKGYFK
jgi:hypothetical protein